MNHYLGIDIGTTSAKAIAFSPAGDAIASHSIGYGMQHPSPGWSEQDPEEILQAVINSLNAVVQTLAPASPVFVSFSAALHSLIAVDVAGNPLTPCIIWADNRASAIADSLRNTETGTAFYHATGVPVHSMSPLCKLLWLKAHNPEVFRDAYKFIGIKEYVFFRLFGVFMVDTSIASGTGLLNLQTLQWDQQVLNFAGIADSRLSEVVSVKHVFIYSGANAQLSLVPQTPVVAGGSDGALSNLGSGAVSSHSMAVTIGTSGAARMVVNEAQTDPRMRTFCYHVKDGNYIVGGATNNGAVVLQWLKETLLQTEDSYEALFEQAQTIAAGSEGLLFLPYILGERAPLWNSHACGVYFGLGIRHTKAHLIRAAMEGVVHCLYSIGKILLESREVTALHASGGFARSPLWLQMVADMFKVKVLVSGEVESSALGAVMVGAEALGIPHDLGKKVLSVYEPNQLHGEVYRRSAATFERIYGALKQEMKEDTGA